MGQAPWLRPSLSSESLLSQGILGLQPQEKPPGGESHGTLANGSEWCSASAAGWNHLEHSENTLVLAPDPRLIRISVSRSGAQAWGVFEKLHR